MTKPEQLALTAVEQLADDQGYSPLDIQTATHSLHQKGLAHSNSLALVLEPKGVEVAEGVYQAMLGERYSDDHDPTPNPAPPSPPAAPEQDGATKALPPTKQPATAFASDKFLVLTNLINPAEWSLQFCTGMIVSRADFNPTIDVNDLIARQILRAATRDEVEKFDRDFPNSEQDEADHAARVRAFRKSLDMERRKAKRWSARAALCSEWIKKFAQLKADTRRVWETMPSPQPSQLHELRLYVAKNREAKKVYDPCRELKEQLRQLAESLVIEAEEFSDLPSTPLINFIGAMGMQWNGLDPTQMPAQDYLERLRFRFLNKEPRPGLVGWAKHQWKILTAVVVGISIVVGAVAKIVHESKSVRDDLKPRPTSNP